MKYLTVKQTRPPLSNAKQKNLVTLVASSLLMMSVGSIANAQPVPITTADGSVQPITSLPITALSTSSSTQLRTVKNSSPIYYGTEGNNPFSTAVRVGNTLYLSGELGLKDGKLVDGGVQAETKQALENINQTLLKYGYQQKDLVKCMVMLKNIDDFSDFNNAYTSTLSSPYPTRSAFGVADLALNASVEIECMAAK